MLTKSKTKIFGNKILDGFAILTKWIWKKKLDSMILTEYLDKYAETGKEYVKILQQIIRQNDLTDFDDAKLLPSSKDLESLI